MSPPAGVAWIEIRLSYEAQQFVLGYMVARANCTANTTPADQPEQKKPA